MSKMYACVVAFYLGKRRMEHQEFVKDRLYYLRKQLMFFKENKINGMDLLVIVINSDDTNDDDSISKLVNEFDLPCEKLLLIRPNTDGSYGAWHDAVIDIIESRSDIDAVMLIEDDYIPVRTDFLDLFYVKLKDNVGYVCQYWSSNLCTPEHASISNGMLDINKAKEIYKVYDKVFELINGSRYDDFATNQINFLNLIKTKYKIVDMKEYRHPFVNGLNINGNLNVCFYGNGNEVLIRPITEGT